MTYGPSRVLKSRLTEPLAATSVLVLRDLVDSLHGMG